MRYRNSNICNGRIAPGTLLWVSARNSFTQTLRIINIRRVSAGLIKLTTEIPQSFCGGDLPFKWVAYPQRNVEQIQHIEGWLNYFQVQQKLKVGLHSDTVDVRSVQVQPSHVISQP